MTAAATFVLVPGGGGAGWVWSRLVPALQDLGRRAVAVDLPGDDESVDLHGYVDLVEAQVRSVAGPVVLVGLSLGGFTAAAVASRTPVSGLVLLNAMIPLPGESPAQWWRAVGQADARRQNEQTAGRDPQRPFDPIEVFLHDAPADVLAEAAEHERQQSDRAFGTPWPAPPSGAPWPDVPTRALVADDDRLFPPELQERVARERLALEVERLPGGHLVPLTRPHELAQLLVD